MGPRRDSDGEVTVFSLKEELREVKFELKELKTNVTNLMLWQAEWKGSMRFLQALLGLLTAAVGTEIGGHVLGWFSKSP